MLLELGLSSGSAGYREVAVSWPVLPTLGLPSGAHCPPSP